LTAKSSPNAGLGFSSERDILAGRDINGALVGSKNSGDRLSAVRTLSLKQAVGCEAKTAPLDHSPAAARAVGNLGFSPDIADVNVVKPAGLSDLIGPV
jgi:hypothetical protein